MVFRSAVLCRVPVIRFRKGGLGQRSTPTAGTTAASPAAPAAAAPAQAAPAAASMSTSAIPDIDLPLRYQRRPLSQEEIDHINGGGIV